MIQTFKSRQPDLIGFQWKSTSQDLLVSLTELIGHSDFLLSMDDEHRLAYLEYNDIYTDIYHNDYVVKYPDGSIAAFEDYEFEKLYQVS